MSDDVPVRRGGSLEAERENADDNAFVESLNALTGDADLQAVLASRELGDPDAALPRLPHPLQTHRGAVCRKRRVEDWVADLSNPPMFPIDDVPDPAGDNEQNRSNKRQHLNNCGDADSVPDFQEYGLRSSGPPGTMSADPGRWVGYSEQDPAGVAQPEESSLSSLSSLDYSDSEFGWQNVPDLEEATVLDTREVLPSSRDDLRVFQKRLDIFEKAHTSHWYRVEDEGAAGSLKVVRISNADAWNKRFWKQHAAETVERCLKYGLEVIHLESALLGSVSSTSLRTLRYLTKNDAYLNQFGKGSGLHITEYPRDNRFAPYVSFIPRIKLYLEKNRLQFLPGVLYSTGNLRNLVELDLSNNCLQWLPYELKKLAINPNQLKIAGNPLLLANVDHPGGQPPNHAIKVENIKANFQDGMWLRRITAVTPLDKFGSARGATGRTSMFHASIRSSPPMVDPEWLKAYVPCEEPLPILEHATQVPSLIETVLRTASRQPVIYPLVAGLPEDLPPMLGMFLRHALRLKEAERQKCSVCAKAYYIPRTEWIEWWSFGIDADNKAWIPFIRFGCSPSCFVDREAREASMGWMQGERFIRRTSR